MCLRVSTLWNVSVQHTGISYPPIEEDRSATMPRMEGKKTKIRHNNLLSALPGSEEFISGGEWEMGKIRYIVKYVLLSSGHRSASGQVSFR